MGPVLEDFLGVDLLLLPQLGSEHRQAFGFGILHGNVPLGGQLPGPLQLDPCSLQCLLLKEDVTLGHGDRERKVALVVLLEIQLGLFQVDLRLPYVTLAEAGLDLRFLLGLVEVGLGRLDGDLLGVDRLGQRRGVQLDEDIALIHKGPLRHDADD